MANHNDGMCPGFQKPIRGTRVMPHSAFFRYLSSEEGGVSSQVFTLEYFRVCERYALEPPTGHTRARNVHWLFSSS